MRQCVCVQTSSACRDLLSRMLVADPADRITVPEIMAHPWVRSGMGALEHLNNSLLQVMGMAHEAVHHHPPSGFSPAAAAHNLRRASQQAVDAAAAMQMQRTASTQRLLGLSDMNAPGVPGWDFQRRIGINSFALAPATTGLGGIGSGCAAPAGRGRATSLDIPRLGAVAANRAQVRTGGCRQSLAEIARLLSAAQAATADENRRAARSLDLGNTLRISQPSPLGRTPADVRMPAQPPLDRHALLQIQRRQAAEQQLQAHRAQQARQQHQQQQQLRHQQQVPALPPQPTQPRPVREQFAVAAIPPFRPANQRQSRDGSASVQRNSTGTL